MKFEWKFYVTLLATLSGVVVPIWLWQADVGGKSLAITLISSVELQVAEHSSIPDLQVTIGGTAIKSPVLSTIEVSNDGSKPVPASDYEGAIEIGTTKNSKIIRANVSSTYPDKLPVHLETTSQSIKIYPLLLNPGDKIKISIISSGNLPALTSLSRIAGISAIKYIDETRTDKVSPMKISWELVKFLTCLTLYFVFSTYLFRGGNVGISKALAICSMFCFTLLAAHSVKYMYLVAEAERSLINMWPIALVTLIVGSTTYYHSFFKPRASQS